MSSWSKNVQFSIQDINYMYDNNIKTISSILDHKKLGHKGLFLPLIRPEIEDILNINPTLLENV